MTSARDKTHEPIAHDAWMTIDPRPIPALLKHVKLRGMVWEPACGKCDMARKIEDYGYPTFSTDLLDYGSPLQSEAFDFLTTDSLSRDTIKSIVTNPPNNLNLEFALNAIKLMQPVNGLVAFYQRHEWDTTQRTAPIFDHPAYAMKIVCRFRPRWIGPEDGKKSVSPFHRWSWYIWDFRHSGPPVIKFS